MEELLKQLLDGQARLEKKLNNLENGQEGIKVQLDENTQIIKALLHRTEELCKI
jgi:hypothetical protein